MKRGVVCLLFAIAIHSFYMIEYESYKFNPCYNDMCLAISCPPSGCLTQGSKTFCPDEKCVNDLLNKYGEEHLTGVFKVEWFDGTQPTVTKLNPVKSYQIK